MPNSVLTICAHPDDETLGCGGTLLRHRAAGDLVHWLIATRALGDRWSDADRARKSREIERVAESYGVSRRFELGLPSAGLDRVAQSELMDGIAGAVARTRPNVVYLVHGGDVHSDHHAVFQAAMSVLKPFHMARWGVERILAFETLSSTEAAPLPSARTFAPNVFVDISPFLEQKVAIMSRYESEVQADPMPRGPSAIRALARLRGATVAVEYAEAFLLIRETVGIGSVSEEIDGVQDAGREMLVGAELSSP